MARRPGLAKVIDAAGHRTVGQNAGQRGFDNRYSPARRFSLHEFLTLLQGYDSVRCRSDLELAVRPEFNVRWPLVCSAIGQRPQFGGVAADPAGGLMGLDRK